MNNSYSLLLLYLTYFFWYLLKAEMKNFSSSDTSVLKQHYEKKILELEHQKKNMQVNYFIVLIVLQIESRKNKYIIRFDYHITERN